MQLTVAHLPARAPLLAATPHAFLAPEMMLFFAVYCLPSHLWKKGGHNSERRSEACTEADAAPGEIVCRSRTVAARRPGSLQQRSEEDGQDGRSPGLF